MLSSVFFCVWALAQPPKVDHDAGGNVITVRPLEGHTVGVFDSDGSRFDLPAGMAQPMWLVHPEAWRKAVALAERVHVSEQLVPELQSIQARLEADLATEKRLRSELRIDLERSEATRVAENRMLRRSRIHWAVGAGGTSLLIGLATGFFVL